MAFLYRFPSNSREHEELLGAYGLLENNLKFLDDASGLHKKIKNREIGCDLNVGQVITSKIIMALNFCENAVEYLRVKKMEDYFSYQQRLEEVKQRFV